jgi:hypothetical protein
MLNFAVLDEKNVINTIIADSKAIAEEITGKTCVEFTIENAEIGGTYENDRFIKRKPYPSWILNEEFNWIAPVPYPDDSLKSYYWSEETLSWIELIIENSTIQ